jgi:hypothetical protein
MRPYHRFAVFKTLDRDGDLKLQQHDGSDSILVSCHHGRGRGEAWRAHGLPCYQPLRHEDLAQLGTLHSRLMYSMSFLVPGSTVSAYDYALMRERMRPFKCELLGYVMHPCRVHCLTALGLL